MAVDPAAKVLDMLSETIGVINSGRPPDQTVVDHLAEALNADLAISVHLDPDSAPELMAGFPERAAAAPLFQRLVGHGEGYLKRHVTMDEDPRFGNVVYVLIRPQDDTIPAEGFGRVLAFARQAAFDNDDKNLLERACRPLAALWPQAARATALRRVSDEDFRMTDRELQVLQLLAEGLLATSIAHRLSLSPRTVHKHLGNIYRKLGVHDRLVAVGVAQARGLLWSQRPASPTWSSARGPLGSYRPTA